VSVARVSSLTWTVKVKLPAVLGTPLISPVAAGREEDRGARPGPDPQPTLTVVCIQGWMRHS
jgi:hypothetical protein